MFFSFLFFLGGHTRRMIQIFKLRECGRSDTAGPKGLTHTPRICARTPATVLVGTPPSPRQRHNPSQRKSLLALSAAKAAPSPSASGSHALLFGIFVKILGLSNVRKTVLLKTLLMKPWWRGGLDTSLHFVTFHYISLHQCNKMYRNVTTCKDK